MKLPPGCSAKLAGRAAVLRRCASRRQRHLGRRAAGQPDLPGRLAGRDRADGAGPGTDPFFLGGKAYLTGPYKGAPYGLAVVVPAVAGPFDLGTVVVRQALYVDPTTRR